MPSSSWCVLSAGDKAALAFEEIRLRYKIMDKLVIAGQEFESRLFIGTGKYASSAVMAQAIEASGTQMVTVALRRVDIDNPNDNLLAAIDRNKYLLLPNTSGARDAAEAVRLARLARAATGIACVKLEVTPYPYYLLPDG